MSVIEIDNAEVWYGGFQALRGVSMRIEGGAVGLLGPNGAGKSTLMKTLLGFNRVRSGSVRMFGMEMPRNALAVRQRLGYMPEREVLSPQVSAVTFLCYCAEMFGMNRIDALERTHEVLNYVGLGESRYRKMQTFSTGMLQRVKLAQAIVHDPSLLLLDEPTNGLDPDGRIEMLDLVREIASKRGVTVLLSSHLMPDVQHTCERVIMMKRGKVIRDGLISEMTEAMPSSYEVDVRDGHDRYQQGLAQAGCRWQVTQEGRIVVTLPDGAPRRLLFEVARDQGVQVRRLAAGRHSLTDVFMQALQAAPGAEED
ncbi:MAG: putative transporter ATP-binding protein YxlF [Candidatus Hydrogenedentota bacterium]